MYPQYCKIPETRNEIHLITEEYRRNGFPGCIGSVDVTHVTWWRPSSNLKQYCASRYHKITLAYEVTVDHNRRCLHCSPGFYGSFNDKTIVKFDRFISSINNKERYADEEYEIYDVHGNLTTEKGLYLLSDNGYHPWRCLQYPNRTKSNTDTLLHHDWSCRLESIRKDVECFFGILKRRWSHH